MSKEIARPINLQRPSFSSSSGLSRSYGSLSLHPNNNNRITRRKSSNLTPTAISAVVQALGSYKGGDAALSAGILQSRIVLSSNTTGSLPSPPIDVIHSRNDSAVIDGPPLASILEAAQDKDRLRRASEGSTLSSKKKLSSSELKCDTCGKSYKHSSCLTKHLWEHTPEWTITSKLLISKHQQVQLLEAASVLVSMTQENGETSRSSDSDESDRSHGASNTSDREESISSAETTPPPTGDLLFFKPRPRTDSTYSKSLQSVITTTEERDSLVHHHRHWSTASSQNPLTATKSLPEQYPKEDHADLAAAVGLLSCSYATPHVGPVLMDEDVPSVPTLTTQYSHERPIFTESGRTETVIVPEDRLSHSLVEEQEEDDDEGIFGMEE